MKLHDILEHDIVPSNRLDPKVFWTIPKMDQVDPPFTKGAFRPLLDVTGGDGVKDPVGGKVLRKDNTMKKGELCKKKKSKKSKKSR